MGAPRWAAVLWLGLTLACGERQHATSDTVNAVDSSGTMRGGARVAGAGDAELERAARSVVRFLRTGSSFDSLLLADTVELRVAPEGGGASRRVARQALRDRYAWTIGDGNRRVVLVPPVGHAAIDFAVGQHYRCQVQDLARSAQDWAARPHVGVRQQPDSAASCLQSWNATFVFDTAAGDPRLTGVLYDQWEW